jgi:hypothetical protein
MNLMKSRWRHDCPTLFDALYELLQLSCLLLLRLVLIRFLAKIDILFDGIDERLGQDISQVEILVLNET